MASTTIVLGNSETPGTPMEGLSTEKVVYLNEQQSHEVMKALLQQRMHGTYCDVVIKTSDNRDVLAHSCVLAANSRYFKDASMRKAPGEKYCIVHMDCLDASCIDTLLEYMYSGSLPISMASVEGMLNLSNKYSMDDIKHCCNLHLQKHIDLSNWWFVMQLGIKFVMSDLQECVSNFCVSNIDCAFKDDKFQLIPFEIFTNIISLCNMHNTRECELLKVSSVLRWTLFLYMERANHLGSLLETVVKSRISKADFSEILKDVLGPQVNHAILGRTEMFSFTTALSENVVSVETVGVLPCISNAGMKLEPDNTEAPYTTVDMDSLPASDKPVADQDVNDLSSIPNTPSQISESACMHNDTDVYDQDLTDEVYKVLSDMAPSSISSTHEAESPKTSTAEDTLESIPSKRDFAGCLQLKPSSDASNVEEYSTATPSEGELSISTVLKKEEPDDVSPPVNVTYPNGRRTKKQNPRVKGGIRNNTGLLETANGKFTNTETTAKRSRSGRIVRKPRKQDPGAYDKATTGLTTKAPKLNKGDKALNEQDRAEGDLAKLDASLAELYVAPKTEVNEDAMFFPPLPARARRPRGKKATKEEDMYRCTKCDRKFPTPSKLRQHLKGHGSDTPYLCAICGFSTVHAGSMNIHMKLHNGKPLKCSVPGCEFETIRRSRLDDHVDGHRGVKNHVCSICGKAFAGRKHMQRHEKIHNIQNPLACPDRQCDYSTGRKDKLKDHVIQHHPDIAIQLGYGKPVGCRVAGCPAPLVTEQQMKEHLKKDHPEEAFEIGYLKHSEYIARCGGGGDGVSAGEAHRPRCLVSGGRGKDMPRVKLRLKAPLKSSAGVSLAIAGPPLDAGDKAFSATEMITLLTRFAQTQSQEAAGQAAASPAAAVKLIYQPPQQDTSAQAPTTLQTVSSPGKTSHAPATVLQSIVTPSGEVMLKDLTEGATTDAQTTNTYVLNIAPNAQY